MGDYDDYIPEPIVEQNPSFLASVQDPICASGKEESESAIISASTYVSDGDRVQLVGLKRAKREYNDKIGAVVGNVKNGKLMVKLDSGESMEVSSFNVKACPKETKPETKSLDDSKEPSATLPQQASQSGSDSGFILSSKEIPAKFYEECEASFGSVVAKLVAQIYARRRMLDCVKIPSAYTEQSWEECWSGNDYSRDPEGEEMVHNLIQELRTSGQKFIDPDFPPADISLFADPTQRVGANAGVEKSFRKDQDPFLAGEKDLQWKRPEHIGNPKHKSVVFSGDISPDDVAQGSLGNCYFLAALASCADGHDDILLKDLIVEEGFNYNFSSVQTAAVADLVWMGQGHDVGLYGVKFFIGGSWTTIVVDDYFPCKLTKGQWTPIFASPKAHLDNKRDEKELWSMIFEKAWAKLHLSYEATALGFTSDAHNYLTGGVCSTLTLGSNSEKEWASIKEMSIADDFAFLSAVCRPELGAQLKKMGLISGHAYSILATYEDLTDQQVTLHGMKDGNFNGKTGVCVSYNSANGEWLVKLDSESETIPCKGEHLQPTHALAGLKLIHVRNPWGSDEWNGAYSDKSDLWTTKLRDTLGSADQEWEDFTKFFGAVDVCDPRMLCRMYSDNAARVDGVAACWIAGKCAGGKASSSTFAFNPRFELIAQSNQVYITVYQPDIRAANTLSSTDWIGSYVYLLDSTRQNEPPVQIIELAFKRQASALISIEPGRRYIVMVTAWGPGVEGAFTVTACGNNCTLVSRPLREPGPEAAKKMAPRASRREVCLVSGDPIAGSYYNTLDGPVLAANYNAYRFATADKISTWRSERCK